MMSSEWPPGANAVRSAAVLGWSEKEFQAHVVKLAKVLGWLAYHTYDSRKSEPGYPDLHLVHTTRRASLFRELKTTKGTATRDQKKWMDALVIAEFDVAVWRPADWLSGAITRELKGERRA